MAKKIMAQRVAAELKRLYVEYPVAVARATAILRTKPPAHEPKGVELRRFLTADDKVGKIARRIREIQGMK